MLLPIYLCAALAQPSPQQNPGPVQAELIAPLNVRHVESGSTVFARVTLDWNGPDCFLRAGSTLEATVEVAARHKIRTGSQLALSFTKAQCNGPDMKPMSLLLAAVAAPPADWENVPDAVFKMPVMFMNPNGTTGFGGAGIGGFSLSHMELKGIIHRFPMSPAVQPGAVIEIKGMKLGIANGPNRSSVLTTRDRDITLDPFTQFLLAPSSMISFAPSPAVINSENPPVQGTSSLSLSAPSPAPANDLEVCAPPGCSVDVPITQRDLARHDASSIDIQQLGFAPRSRRVLDDFNDEEALAWLGPGHLLLAFNSHPLIYRGGASSTSAPRRVIRAVLLDTARRTVERAVDWQINDSHRYLWPLNANHILVHAGNELRIYDANLAVERRFALAGPLDFVRITPNGHIFAVATLQERHSPELHARLHDSLGAEPEEDVNVTILDQAFNTIAHASSVSGLMPPTLLDEGQVNLLAQPNSRYRLVLNNWNSDALTLARFTSSCAPDISSVAPDLLFLLTCDTATGTTEYRVLGADGKLLLRRQAASREIGQEAVGSQGTGRFAIKVVNASDALSTGMQFKAADLQAEEVRVYRVSDRKRLLSVSVEEPVASLGAYALSPDGASLAVLSQSKILIFPMPND